ncbi:MAG: hypothetical protein RXP92_02660 [Candidatus Micrarchaeota archaeon]
MSLGNKLTALALTLAIILQIYYQISYILQTNPAMPFMEPDNYLYLLFAQIALNNSSLNASNISNPYLIGAPRGFFEHPGLYQLPVLVARLTGLPLVWAFRLSQGVAVLGIYLFVILFIKKVLDNTYLSKTWKNLAYTIGITVPFLMQYTEIIEWRGSEFIELLSLIIVYFLADLFTQKKGGKVLLDVAAIGLALGFGWWMWSGWPVLPVSLGLMALLGLGYRYFIANKPERIRYVVIVFIIAIIFLFIFFKEVRFGVMWALSKIRVAGVDAFIGSNPLQLSEAEVLNYSNGLFAVLAMLFFGAIALFTFLGKTYFIKDKQKYEYLLVLIIAMAIALLPLAMNYIRLVSLAAPYLAVLYALGFVGFFNYFIKTGSNKIVLGIAIFLFLIGNFVGSYMFYLSAVYLYHYANPQGLLGVGNYLKNYMNSTVFAYYGYGDWLEQYAHVKVYADTIQGLNPTTIGEDDKVFYANGSEACALLQKVEPKPNFILVSKDMLNVSLFANATNQSIIREPLGLSKCSRLVYNQSGFYLFRASP